MPHRVAAGENITLIAARFEQHNTLKAVVRAVAMQDLTIRPFTPKDYPSFTALWNHAYPENRGTSVSFKLLDHHRSPELTCRRWVAEHNGEIIGVGCFEHWEEFYHPRKYLMHIIVDEEQRRQGVGAAIYNHVTDELLKLQPLVIRGWVKHNNSDGNSFAQNRGFIRERLRWNLLLGVQECDLTPYARHEARLKRHGVTIKRFAELPPDPGRDRKLYELYRAIIDDLDTPDAATPMDFAAYARALQTGSVNNEVSVAAIDEKGDGEYVGMWNLSQTDDATLYGDVMGVKPEHRRRGIALCLLARAISYAKQRGYVTITAHTDEHNKDTLALADRLGFVRSPQSLFAKSL